MNWHDIPLSFGSLLHDGANRFVWNSTDWWSWFKSHRRKPSEASIRARLREHDSFITFHCARPIDVATFYVEGLKLGDISSLNARAREIFLSGHYPQITPVILEKAISDAMTIHDQTLFAVLDEREISGHYLIYGSEHICGIAASMIREVGFDCRQILKRYGTPTVFRIALPRELIPEDQLDALAHNIWYWQWDERKLERPPEIDFSFVLKCPIPGAHFIDHFHPPRIPDPLLQYTPYTYRDNFSCFY